MGSGGDLRFADSSERMGLFHRLWPLRDLAALRSEKRRSSGSFRGKRKFGGQALVLGLVVDLHRAGAPHMLFIEQPQAVAESVFVALRYFVVISGARRWPRALRAARRDGTRD